MTYDVLNLTFNEPTASEVSLTDDLAKTIHQFQKQRRERSVSMTLRHQGALI